MRILVLSDSHGDRAGVRLAIKNHPEAKLVLHLGDGNADIKSVMDEFPDREFVCVKGNCDFGSDLPESEIITLAGKRIYVTHGYLERVKYGTDLLLATALENGADIALYGHTHVQKTDYEAGVHIFNPGSVRNGNYGLVDIVSGGIICIGASLN